MQAIQAGGIHPPTENIYYRRRKVNNENREKFTRAIDGTEKLEDKISRMEK
jgi:hypothetical protein